MSELKNKEIKGVLSEIQQNIFPLKIVKSILAGKSLEESHFSIINKNKLNLKKLLEKLKTVKYPVTENEEIDLFPEQSFRTGELKTHYYRHENVFLFYIKDYNMISTIKIKYDENTTIVLDGVGLFFHIKHKGNFYNLYASDSSIVVQSNGVIRKINKHGLRTIINKKECLDSANSIQYLLNRKEYSWVKFPIKQERVGVASESFVLTGNKSLKKIVVYEYENEGLYEKMCNHNTTFYSLEAGVYINKHLEMTDYFERLKLNEKLKMNKKWTDPKQIEIFKKVFSTYLNLYDFRLKNETYFIIGKKGIFKEFELNLENIKESLELELRV
tara:strand:+ start:43992 stop:44978 length:987 start_codon:yes stop_codon:yes gene_type:complete